MNLRLHDSVTGQEIKLFLTPSRITLQCLGIEPPDHLKVRRRYLKWLATKLPAEIIASHAELVLAVKKPVFSKD